MFDGQDKLPVIHEYQIQDIQPFLNPICKQTYNALPKIYGNNRRKRYYSQQSQPTYSMHQRKISRDCCSRQFQEYHRAITDVNLLKSKIYHQLLHSKGKVHSAKKRRKPEYRHKTIQHSQNEMPTFRPNKKILLPSLKEFHTEQLVEKESKHKVYHTIQGLASQKMNNLVKMKYSLGQDIKKQINNDYSSSQHFSKAFQVSQGKKVTYHRKSLTEDIIQPKQNNHMLQKDYKTIQQIKPRYKLVDKKASNNSHDDTFSISSSVIKRENRLSTLFHKYKTISSNKNQEEKPQKEESRVYSVLSNGLFKIPEKDEYQEYLLNYKSMNSNFDIKTLIKQPNFYIVPLDDKVYFGQIINQKQNGKGITVSEKQIFQGTYNQNVKIEGCQKNRDGVYTGGFLNSKRNGKGKFVWNNGQIFEGQWREGKKNGFGVWRSLKGDSYEGQWKDNRQTGKGLFIHHARSKYQGEFKDFLKHGHGQQQFINGDIYDGQYFQGKPHGNGKYIWSNGDVYQGNFQQGSRSGFGVLNLANGQRYEGHFKNDVKHGNGKQCFKSGQKFQGEFRNGQRLCGKLKTKAGVVICITQ